MPLDLIVWRAWSIFSTGMFVHVKCIIVSTHIVFCILFAMSSVRSAVEPPAPQVMSQNAGLWATIRSIRSNKFSTPSSVFGGKNSKEKTTLSEATFSWILSITFIFGSESSYCCHRQVVYEWVVGWVQICEGDLWKRKMERMDARWKWKRVGVWGGMRVWDSAFNMGLFLFYNGFQAHLTTPIPGDEDINSYVSNVTPHRHS